MSSAPTLHHVTRGHVELAYFEWNAERRGEGPSILLAHATGFHARCWDPVIARLGARHVIAADARGHGRSSKPEITGWKVFGEDLAELARSCDLERLVGVGHSMGGHALVDAAAEEGARFRELLLIDPVIAPPETYEEIAWVPLPEGELHPTAKRKNHFASVEAMIERFEDRHPYSLFDPEALRAYCTHGLLPAPDGDGLVLACPPATEATVYMTSRSNVGIFESIGKIGIPVTILRARRAERLGMMDFSTSPTWPGLASAFRDGRDEHLTQLSHFIPMQDPQLVADRILTLAAGA